MLEEDMRILGDVRTINIISEGHITKLTSGKFSVDCLNFGVFKPSNVGTLFRAFELV